jgi:hypothetical protein
VVSLGSSKTTELARSSWLHLSLSPYSVCAYRTESASPLQHSSTPTPSTAAREPLPTAASASSLLRASGDEGHLTLAPVHGDIDRLGPAILGAGGQGQGQGREPQCLSSFEFEGRERENQGPPSIPSWYVVCCTLPCTLNLCKKI